MFTKDLKISDFDQEIWNVIEQEQLRQEKHIEMIASENYASPRVLAAQGSVLTNKYAEGYPRKRYYHGCEFVDLAEELAIERAKRLFKADYANVQPHSGSQANAAAYAALLNVGETILGMGLNYGGHLTHGSKVNFSGKLYKTAHYGVNYDTGLIDYDEVKDLADKHKPKLIIAGFSAYSRKVDWKKFRDIADSVGAYLLVDIAHVAGLIVAEVYPSPIEVADVVTSTTHKTLRGPRGGIILARSNPEIEKKLNSAVFPGNQGGPLMHVIAAKAVAFQEALSQEFKIYQQQVISNAKHMANIIMKRGYKVISNGTDNHLFLVDLIEQKLTGQFVGDLLVKANIIINKNMVPKDPNPPALTSGIRIGTPAVTTRGFKEKDVGCVANWVCDLLEDHSNEKLINEIKQKSFDLCESYPVYKQSNIL